MVQPPRVLLCAAVWFTGACEPATQRDAPSTTTRLDRPQQWTFAPGLTVALRAWPARARVGTPLVVTLEPEGQEENAADVANCEWVVTLRPPADASQRVVHRGADARFIEDPRTVRARAPADAIASLTFTLDLPAGWVWRTAALELELACEGEAQPVRAGASRRPRRGNGGAPPSIATLGVVQVQPTPRVLDAVRVEDGEIRVDGVLDESVWSRASAPLFESRHGDAPARVGAPRTEAWMAWDAQALYVAARAEDPDIVATLTDRDAPLWEEDVFEIFVFSTAASTYLEVQGSPRGTLFDAAFTRVREGGATWDGGASTAASVQYASPDSRKEVGWSVEFALPWLDLCAHTDIRCPPSPGDTLNVNLFRIDRGRDGARVGLSLSPTWVPDFHRPSAAAHVQLRGAMPSSATPNSAGPTGDSLEPSAHAG